MIHRTTFTLEFSEDQYFAYDHPKPVPEPPISSQDLRSRDRLQDMAYEEKFLSSLHPPQLDFETARSKRQVSLNLPDCKGKKEECQIILEGTRFFIFIEQ